MKHYFFIVFSLLFVQGSKAQSLQVLNFETVQAMHSYFQDQDGKIIISGHRGTVENGMPENSIAGMEEVLRHTKAIFEVDPRLSKDGIPVIIHDDTLDRTTTGTGKVSDYTLVELKEFFLKDANGNITPYRIPTLDELIIWAKGKTILNLDRKNVPDHMIADIIRKHNAYAWVWVTVHTVDQADFFLNQNSDQFLSMHIRSVEALDKFKKSNLPYNRMIVYIGPRVNEGNIDVLSFFKQKNVMCMISSASSYDKLKSKEERSAMYKKIAESGATIIESDFPIEVSRAIYLNP